MFERSIVKFEFVILIHPFVTIEDELKKMIEFVRDKFFSKNKNIEIKFNELFSILPPKRKFVDVELKEIFTLLMLMSLVHIVSVTLQDFVSLHVQLIKQLISIHFWSQLVPMNPGLQLKQKPEPFIPDEQIPLIQEQDSLQLFPK